MKLTLPQRTLIVIGLACVLGGILLATWRHTRAAEDHGIVYIPPRVSPANMRPIAVHVVGAVAHPGLYWLPPGSRISDAVQQAGGLMADADPASVNLAQVIKDGQQVRVADKPTTPSVSVPAITVSSPPPSAAPPPSRRPSTRATTGAPATASRRARTIPARPLIVHLNTATEQQLESLPGIGPALADRIVRHRTQCGGFRSVDELTQVSGIGPAKMEVLRPYLRL